MAYRNYNFVIDSSFQPFSMQEMLAPLTLYKEAFEKSEEAYTDLKTKADVFKELGASLPENSKAKQIYEGYANDLNSQAEDLARNGLNMGNRRALTSLKQRYSGEIGRLDRAKTALEEAKKTRSALEASGKRRLYATNNFTIDDFLDGNTPNMYSVDPDVLYAKGAQRGKSVSSRMTDIKEGGNMIDGYFRNIIQSTGMDPQKLNRWMQSDEFSKMVDLAMLEEGVAGNLEGMDYLRAKQAYVSGIFDGVVYTEKNDLQRNPNMLTPKERHDMAMDNARLAISREELNLQKFKAAIDAKKAEAEAKKAEKEATASGGIGPNPMNIYSQKERDNSQNYINNFSKYFYRGADGGVRLSKAGLEEYNRKYTSSAPTSMGFSQPVREDSPFKKFIDSIGGKNAATGKMVGTVGNMWDKYVKSHQNNAYDAKQRTEFDAPIASSHQEEMKSSIQIATGGADLNEVDFSEKDGKFTKTGKSLSMKELNGDKYKVESTRFSPYGNTVIIKNPDGKSKRYELPYGINPYNENNRDMELANIKELQGYISSGVITDGKGNKHTLTPEELAVLSEDYKKAVQNAYMFHSQIGIRNKTKEQEFIPYSY